MTNIKECRKISKNCFGGEALEVELDNGEIVVFEDYNQAMQDVGDEKYFIKKLKQEEKDKKADKNKVQIQEVREERNKTLQSLNQFKKINID
jgi:hypothetical protein